jgi:hypothetical protein
MKKEKMFAKQRWNLAQTAKFYKKFGDISAQKEEGAKALYFYFTAEHLKEQSISQ